MAKIVGVGGIFLEFQGEKDALHKWYHQNLGLDMTDYGTGFMEGKQLMVVSFKKDSENAPMINFRVDDIAGMVEKLKKMYLEVKDMGTYEYGKFVHFVDPFGNLIELWEPIEETYISMVKNEIDGYGSKS